MSHPIVQQHRRLRPLFEEIRAAFRRADAAGARDALERLRGALETHFEQEDRLYYPIIASLRPSHKIALARFGEAHDQFRASLETIAGALASGALGEAEPAFEDLANRFADHEVHEEEVVRSLESEVAGAR